MLLLLIACCGVSFVFHRYAARTRISGTVIDWISGRPVPDLDVYFKELNGSSKAATTDAQGRFTAVVPRAAWLYLLYVEDPRFGPLLQSTFGHTVAVYTGGEQHSGVVVPAIPATELSGHVYGEGAVPLRGCEVWALAEDPDHTPPLHDVSLQKTDKAGAFTFSDLGADRYFIVARCSLPWKSQNSWLPMEKTIVLLPGDRRRDVDFHLPSVSPYSIHGKVILSDGSRPRPRTEVLYVHELAAFSLDPALAASTPTGETCDWNANAGDFHCDFFAPGVYELSFQITSELKASVPFAHRQEAKVKFEVKAGNHNSADLTVQLREGKYELHHSSSIFETGFLHLRRDCPTKIRDGWITVSGWGPTTPNLRTPGIKSCAEEKTWPIATGAYTVSAYQADFFGRGSEGNSKILALLRRHGSDVTIRSGSTSKLSVPVWSTEEIIRWALKSLRESAARN